MKILKIECDGSFNKKNRIGKIAIVIKDGRNKIIEEFTEYISANTSSECEFLAIKQAVEWIYSIDFTEYENIHIFNDNQGVCHAINKNNYLIKDVFLHQDKSVLFDFYLKHVELKRSVNMDIQWIPRTANMRADKLSKPTYICK